MPEMTSLEPCMPVLKGGLSAFGEAFSLKPSISALALEGKSHACALGF